MAWLCAANVCVFKQIWLSVSMFMLEGSYIFLRINAALSLHAHALLCWLLAGSLMTFLWIWLQATEILPFCENHSLIKAKHRVVAVLICIKSSFTKLVTVTLQKHVLAKFQTDIGNGDI